MLMRSKLEPGRDLEKLAGLFPDRLAGPIRELLTEKGDRLEEIRLRAGCPVSWVSGDRELILTLPGTGGCTAHERGFGNGPIQKRGSMNGSASDCRFESRPAAGHGSGSESASECGSGNGLTSELGPGNRSSPASSGSAAGLHSSSADQEGLRSLLGASELICGPEDLTQILRRASDYAAYAVQDQLTAGFLSLPGGHRLGVCGQAVPGQNGIRSIRELQSVNLRIAREVPGAADGAVSLLWSHPASTLILGPPGRGKTTVLRDLVRQISDRFRERIGLVDERGEIAACLGGVPQLRVGQRTDVLSLCPKERGILLLLRSMGPRWIALDEISDPADAEALIRASYCGVRFLATAHAWDRSDLEKRPLYRSLMESGVFENLVLIKPDRSLLCERIGAPACDS